ncbi:MAG: MFS transporter [Deltaproteobacteria bacterium]|nr:MFS transporter [Deltaproteobacteria bacterium]
MDNLVTNNASIKKAALIIATTTSFTTPFMASSINIALPSIQKEFQVNAVLLSWVASSYILASVVSLVPFGRLADIHGRKKTFTYGISIFTISSLLSASSFSAPMLIFFRILQGTGSAMIFATGMAILISVFPPQERGKVLGINVAAVYTGLSLGPFLGGLLTQHFTWRSVFLINVPLGLIIISLILWKLKEEWADAKGEKFDFIGSIIYGVSIIAIMYGITLLPAIRSLWLILLGITGISAFVKWESKIENPVFEITLFRTNRVFAFSGLAALINYSATFAVTFLLSLYLQYVKGLSPQGAGLVLISQPIVQAIFSPFAGRVSDRIEPRIVATLGMTLTAIGLFLFTFLDENSPVVFIIARLIVLGFGFALFSSPNTNAIMSSVEKKYYGIASGSVGTMRLLGQMLSMGIATLLFAIYIGGGQITAEYYPAFIKSVKVAFIIFSILCFGGIFASISRGKIRINDTKMTASGKEKPPI